tara:strand:- start:39 stop:917 length:879 start_codon:yes stop_codon:yes gene_type:complete
MARPVNRTRSSPTTTSGYVSTTIPLPQTDFTGQSLLSNANFQDYDNPGGNVGGLVKGVEDDPMELKFRTERQRKEYMGPGGNGDDGSAAGSGENDTVGDNVAEDVGGIFGQFGNWVAPGDGTGPGGIFDGNSLGFVDDIGDGIGNVVSDIGDFFSGWSDVRLKKNIKLIDISKKGYNIYSFEFKDPEKYGKGTFQGVLSHDIPSEFVSKNEDGYNMVDYSFLDVEFKSINKSINTNNKNMKIVQESGVELSTSSRCRPVGTRVMTSRNTNVKSDLSVGDILYKGNAALNANR